MACVDEPPTDNTTTSNTEGSISLPSDGADINRTLAMVRDSFQPVIDAFQRALLDANSAQQQEMMMMIQVNGTEVDGSSTEEMTDFGRSVDEAPRASDFNTDITSTTGTLSPYLADQLAANLTGSGCLGSSDVPLRSAQELIRSWLASEKQKLLRGISSNSSSSNATAGANKTAADVVGSELGRQIDGLFNQLENVTTASLEQAFRTYRSSSNLIQNKTSTAGDAMIGSAAHAPPTVVVLNLEALVFASAEYFAFLNATVHELMGMLADRTKTMPYTNITTMSEFDQAAIQPMFTSWQSNLTADFINRTTTMLAVGGVLQNRTTEYNGHLAETLRQVLRQQAGGRSAVYLMIQSTIQNFKQDLLTSLNKTVQAQVKMIFHQAFGQIPTTVGEGGGDVVAADFPRNNSSAGHSSGLVLNGTTDGVDSSVLKRNRTPTDLDTPDWFRGMVKGAGQEAGKNVLQLLQKVLDLIAFPPLEQFDDLESTGSTSATGGSSVTVIEVASTASTQGTTPPTAGGIAVASSAVTTGSTTAQAAAMHGAGTTVSVLPGSGSTTGVSSAGSTVASVVSGTASTAGSIVPGTGSTAPGAGSTAASVVPGLGSSLASAVPGTGSTAASVVPVTLNSTASVVPVTGSTSASFISGLGSTAASAVPGSGSTIASVIAGSGSSAASVISGSGSTAASVVPGLGSSSASAVPGTGSTTASVVPIPANSSASVVPGTGSTAALVVPGTGSSSASVVPGTASTAGSVVSGLGSTETSIVTIPGSLSTSAVPVPSIGSTAGSVVQGRVTTAASAVPSQESYAASTGSGLRSTDASTMIGQSSTAASVVSGSASTAASVRTSQASTAVSVLESRVASAIPVQLSTEPSFVSSTGNTATSVVVGSESTAASKSTSTAASGSAGSVSIAAFTASIAPPVLPRPTNSSDLMAAAAAANLLEAGSTAKSVQEASTVRDTAGHNFYVYLVEPSIFSRFIKHHTNNSGTRPSYFYLILFYSVCTVPVSGWSVEFFTCIRVECGIFF